MPLMFSVAHLMRQIEAILSRDGGNCGIFACAGAVMEVVSLILRRQDAVSYATTVQRAFSSVLLSFSPIFGHSEVSSPAPTPPPTPPPCRSPCSISASLLPSVSFSSPSSFRRNVRVMKPLCLYSEPAPVQNWIGCSRRAAAPLPLLPPRALFAFSIISPIPTPPPLLECSLLCAKVVLTECSCFRNECESLRLYPQYGLHIGNTHGYVWDAYQIKTFPRLFWHIYFSFMIIIWVNFQCCWMTRGVGAVSLPSWQLILACDFG